MLFKFTTQSIESKEISPRPTIIESETMVGAIHQLLSMKLRPNRAWDRNNDKWHEFPVDDVTEKYLVAANMRGTAKGAVVNVYIYGRPELCEVLTVLPAGTIEVIRLHEGDCFRVSGLSTQAA